MVTHSSRARLFVPFLLAVAGCGGEESATTGAGGAGGHLPDPTIDAGIISQSATSVREAESSLATTADGRVAVAWIALEAGSSAHIGYRFSLDRGETWEPVGQLAGPTGGPCADPVLAADPAGNLYLVWLVFAATTSETDHIYVARSAPGSTAFEAPVEVSDPNDPTFYDKPTITVTGAGTILAAFTRQVGLVAARSSDGVLWERATVVDEPPTRNHIVAGCSTPGGTRVWLTHLHYDDITAERQVFLRWSDDDGASWPAANVTTVSAADELDVGVDDPSCVASGNEVWVLYGRTHDTPSANGFGSLYAVRVAHSADGGQSIAERYDAHDPAFPLELHPRFARTDAGGLAIVSYAGASDGDAAGSVRASLSPDATTFPATILVHEPVTFLDSRTSLKWIGEYFGVDWRDGNLYTAYIDNSGTESHVAFHRTALP
jgi:hypothetical protein